MITFNNLVPDNIELKQIQKAIDRVIYSGRYIGGEEVEKFEAEFAAYVGSKHCIAVGNGFDALQIALLACGVGEGSRVAVPTSTCIPTWAAVHRVGATIVPIEPWENHVIACASFTHTDIDVVIPVHLYGNPVDSEDIESINTYYTVIEDACQAHGSYTNEHHAGTIGNMGCFSFYPTKNLACLGDGGAIVTNSPLLAQFARRLRRYGEPGAINSCLDPMQAAILRLRLKTLDKKNERRNEMATMYRIALADCENVMLPEVRYRDAYNYHQFVIKVPMRDELQKWLKVCHIETMVHYRENLFDVFDIEDPYPGLQRGENILSLPIANVEIDDIIFISEKIKEFYDAKMA